MDLNAEGICGAGVAPVDGVMADDPAGRVVQRPEHRVAGGRRDVHVGHQGFDLLRRDNLGVDAFELVDLGPPAHGAQRTVVVGQRKMPAPGEHHVEVKICGQGAVELHRAVVEPDALWSEVVRADDRGVPSGSAATDVALVQYGDAANPVITGQVVGRGQAVHAGADDHDVVCRP